MTLDDNVTKMRPVSCVVCASLTELTSHGDISVEQKPFIVLSLLLPADVCAGLTYPAFYIVFFALFLLSYLLGGNSGSRAIFSLFSFRRANITALLAPCLSEFQFICPVNMSDLYHFSFVFFYLYNTW